MRSLRARCGSKPLDWTGVSALVMNAKGEVLLQRRTDTGGWGTPGGIAEVGEALEDTLCRELQEGTGLVPLDPYLFTLISGQDTYQKLPGGDEFYQITAIYLIRHWAGTPVPDGQEGTALSFFPWTPCRPP
ncbi:NUDIX domain-containing protein [Deinococcus navajonensis]|uniref:NUDIX domain-containing protein n=1 Tax=Deinococcus navajonensis TaxID=309884 RepID=A0ABV8XP74_9DEIO